jgi:hypothetical protein
LQKEQYAKINTKIYDIQILFNILFDMGNVLQNKGKHFMAGCWENTSEYQGPIESKKFNIRM